MGDGYRQTVLTHLVSQSHIQKSVPGLIETQKGLDTATLQLQVGRCKACSECGCIATAQRIRCMFGIRQHQNKGQGILSRVSVATAAVAS